MAFDLKKIAKKLSGVANTASVLVAGLQSSGLLSVVSPQISAGLLGALAVLNAFTHALPTPDPK